MEVRRRLTLTAGFNGRWNKAQIHNGVLTWKEGEEVPINTISGTSFQMKYFEEGGQNWTYQAELHENGNLHWDDGDIWYRQKFEFEGLWPRAHIHGHVLTWSEGEDVQIIPISATSFRMLYYENVF